MTPSYIQKSNNIEIKGYTPRSFRLALAETCITCNEKTSRLMRPYDDQNAKTELAKFELLEDIAKANIYLYRIRLDTIVAVQFEAEHMPPNYLFVRWATRDWKQYIIALNDKLTMGNSLISSFKQHDDLMLASSSAWYAYARGEMNDDWHPFLKDMEPASLPNSSLSTQPEPEPVKPADDMPNYQDPNYVEIMKLEAKSGKETSKLRLALWEYHQNKPGIVRQATYDALITYLELLPHESNPDIKQFSRVTKDQIKHALSALGIPRL